MANSDMTEIPHIHFLARQKGACELFAQAIEKARLKGSITYTLHEGSLSQLDPSVRFDLVVSPANSYGRLDGGFDDAISCAWAPADDYLALTKAVQAQLYDFCMGYLPPGQCFIAKIPIEFKGKGKYKSDWACKLIALCPTMRVPQPVQWDRDVVYECVWSLLTAIDRHNRAASDQDKIKSMLMTPLATGIGRVELEVWAQQAVLAMKHFQNAKNSPQEWNCMDWADVQRLHDQITKTYEVSKDFAWMEQEFPDDD